MYFPPLSRSLFYFLLEPLQEPVLNAQPTILELHDPLVAPKRCDSYYGAPLIAFLRGSISRRLFS